jgi:hypothetical protein
MKKIQNSFIVRPHLSAKSCHCCVGHASLLAHLQATLPLTPAPPVSQSLPNPVLAHSARRRPVLTATILKLHRVPTTAATRHRWPLTPPLSEHKFWRWAHLPLLQPCRTIGRCSTHLVPARTKCMTRLPCSHATGRHGSIPTSMRRVIPTGRTHLLQVMRL